MDDRETGSEESAEDLAVPEEQTSEVTGGATPYGVEETPDYLGIKKNNKGGHTG